MKRLIGTIFILGIGITGLSQSVVAHERGYRYFDSPRHYRVDVHRDHHMPGWLHRKKDFRRWYGRSAIRHDHALAWWQVYDIYRWERRHHRHHHHRSGRHVSRDYRHKYDHGYRDDRKRRRDDYRDDHRRYRD